MMYERYSLWDRLKSSDKPIVIYGTGNGADKIIDILDAREIPVAAVFASDGFVRERTFRGFKVRSYSDVLNEYGDDIVILLAFGSSLPDVCAYIAELDGKHKLIIPDVPLYGGDLFDFDYFTAHRKSLENARFLLSDERSQKLFDDAVNFRLTGKMKYLSDAEPIEDSLAELFGDSKIGTVVDGGAFRGDTTALFASVLHPSTVYAIEADPRTYAKLCDYAASENNTKVIPINAALSDHDGYEEYVSSSSRGSGEAGKNKRAKVVSIVSKTVDSIVGTDTVDLIKLDIEGDEFVSLKGAASVIERCAPSLAVSLYHRTDDLYSLIEYVHEILPRHRLYLRRVPCIPMWDLVLYAIK